MHSTIICLNADSTPTNVIGDASWVIRTTLKMTYVQSSGSKSNE